MSKSSKKSSRVRAAAIKPLDAQVGVDELIAADGVEDIAVDMVQLIIDKGAAILYGHFIQDKAEEVTAVETIDNIVNTVEFQLMPHDEGELLSAEEAAAARQRLPIDFEAESSSEEEFIDSPPMWTAEPEPRPCDIDLWASGVVPMKQTKTVTPLHGLGPGGIHEITSSRTVRDVDNVSNDGTRSMRSSQSMRSARSIRSAQSTRSNRSSITSSRSKTGRTSTSRLSSTSRMSKMYSHGKRGDMQRINEGPFSIHTPKTPHEMEMDRLRAHELNKMERKRKQLEKKLKLKEAGEEVLRRYEKLKAELAGKVYAFDEDGEVVLVQPPKSMPAFGHHPKISVTDTYEEPEDRPKKKAKPRARGVSNKPNTRGFQKKNQPQKDNGFISLDTQPSLAEKMNLAPGVSLRIGSTIKTGNGADAPQEDISKMTYKQYQRMLAGDRLDTANTEAFGRVRNVVTPTGGVPTVNVENIQVGETSLPDRAAIAQAEKEEEERREAEAAADLLIIPGTARSQQIGEDGKEGDKEEDDIPRQVPRDNDFNSGLMNDPSWGHNPTDPSEPIRPLPVKDNTGALSPPRARGPRRTVADNSSPIRPRPRLPAPVFPATVGHGFIRGEEAVNRSRDISLSVNQLGRSDLTLSLPRDLPRTPGARPQSPRKPGFFPQYEPVAKVETTEKARLYFGSGG